VTKIYYLELLRASEGTLSRCFRLHLQLLAPSNPQWARSVGYDPFSLCVIHEEGLCPSTGDINSLMMMMNYLNWIKQFHFIHTYHSRLIPEGVAEASQKFLRDTHALPKWLSMRDTAGMTGGKPIAVWLQSILDRDAVNPLVVFYDLHRRKREVLFFCSVPDTTQDSISSS
jgi:hypothetical protein